MTRKPRLLKAYEFHGKLDKRIRDWSLEHHVHDDGNTSKRPFYRLMLGLDACQINKSVFTSASSADLCLEDRARVYTAFNLVDGDGLDEAHWHRGKQLFRPTLLDASNLFVPASSLHDKAIDVRSLFVKRRHLLRPRESCDLSLIHRLIQRPLLLTS